MKCEICGQDVKNSEDLKDHKERMHATAAAAVKTADNLEQPDLLGDTPEVSAEIDVPKATH
jgi:hypothetical protein